MGLLRYALSSGIPYGEKITSAYALCLHPPYRPAQGPGSHNSGVSFGNCPTLLKKYLPP